MYSLIFSTLPLTDISLWWYFKLHSAEGTSRAALLVSY